MVAGDRQIIGKHVLLPAFAILLPIASGIFIDAAEADIWRQVFVVLAGQFAGFAAGATT
ncbi:hypothetical protein D3C86_2180280 [compost metagenome]